MRKIDANASLRTKNIEQTHRIEKKLINQCKNQSEYERLPKYDITQLQRGVFCGSCFSKLVRKNKQYFSCDNCQLDYSIDDVALYAIAQYKLLFPEKNITTKSIFDWCGGTFSRAFISLFLKRRFHPIPNGKHTHYTFKNKDEPLKLLSK